MLLLGLGRVSEGGLLLQALAQVLLEDVLHGAVILFQLGLDLLEVLRLLRVLRAFVLM